jgi:hypothetical protein
MNTVYFIAGSLGILGVAWLASQYLAYRWSAARANAYYDAVRKAGKADRQD